MGILKTLFVLIFAAFPLGVLIRISPIAQAYIYPIDIFLIIFILYGVYLLIASKKKSLIYQPIKYFLLAAIISLVVNFFNLRTEEFVISSLYFVRFLILVSIIPVIAYNFRKKDVPFILKTVIVSLFVTVIAGFLQYFLYPDLRNLIYAGWDEHLYRVFSTFLDPNFAAAVFVVTIWAMIVGLKIFTIPKVLRITVFGMIAITLICLLLTYSRTGYLMLAVSAVVFFVLEKRIRFLLLFLVIMIISVFFLPRNLQSEGVNLLRTASIESRIEAFDTAFNLIKDKPVFGVGFNAYRYAQIERGIGGESTRISHAGAGVANSYLFIMATTGIVGFFTFLYFIRSVYLRIFELRSENFGMVNSCMALFTAILVGSLTENIFFYSFILILFFTILGIIEITRGYK